MKSVFVENFLIAVNSIRSHLLRTVITMLIIAFGIMALISILTAIESIKHSIVSNFTQMGANTFTIRNKTMMLHMGGRRNHQKRHKEISYKEAVKFKEEYTFPSTVSINTHASGSATVKYKSIKTNPNIDVLGSDENGIFTSGLEIEKGRNFSTGELEQGSAVTIIGDELRKTLFKDKEDPLNKIITIGPGKYKIIGVLKEKGSGMNFNTDKYCVIPINNVRKHFSSSNMSYKITVKTENPNQLDIAIDEATGLFRTIRKVKLNEDNNFETVKSDNLVKMLIENTKYVTMSATIIGFITLIGAAIGLMNIMLVSVTERTREIGIRKAIGATKKTIKQQFLIESVVICQMGGIFGIILGIVIGNIISLVLHSSFFIPWIWVMAGIILCFAVGMASGIYPAIKAANLNPIDSLRFE